MWCGVCVGRWVGGGREEERTVTVPTGLPNRCSCGPEEQGKRGWCAAHMAQQCAVLLLQEAVRVCASMMLCTQRCIEGSQLSEGHSLLSTSIAADLQHGLEAEAGLPGAR